MPRIKYFCRSVDLRGPEDKLVSCQHELHRHQTVLASFTKLVTSIRDHGHYVTTISVSWTNQLLIEFDGFDLLKIDSYRQKSCAFFIPLQIFSWKRPCHCHYLPTHQTLSAHPKTSHQQKSTYTNSGKRDVAQKTVLRVVMKHLSLVMNCQLSYDNH